MTISVRKYRQGDVMALRPLDAAGVRVLNVQPQHALDRAVSMSVDHFIYELDGEIVAAYGWGSHGLTAVTAYAWLLTSPGIERAWRLFARESRSMVRYTLERHLRIEATCLLAHTTSRRWLDWLGFRECGRTADFLIFERVR